MRNPERIPVALSKIEKVWKNVPDLRLGQLILNALEGEHILTSLYNLEDEVLLQIIEDYYKNRKVIYPKEENA